MLFDHARGYTLFMDLAQIAVQPSWHKKYISKEDFTGNTKLCTRCIVQNEINQGKEALLIFMYLSYASHSSMLVAI